MELAPSVGQTGERQSTQETSRQATSWRSAALLIILALLFAGLAVAAHRIPYFPIDLAVTRTLQTIQAGWFEQLLAAVSWIGFPPQSNFIFGAILVGLFVTGYRWEAVVGLFAAGGSAALWFAIAPIVHRPRPGADLVHVATSIPWGSFPSGHVLNLTATFGIFLYLSYVHVRQRLLRAMCVTICSFVIGLIGVARVYSGEHWPSDVVGGYLLGVLWLLLAIRLYHAGLRAAERRRQRRRAPEAAPDPAL